MELKTHDKGHNDCGPARICCMTVSKTGKSLQYEGKTFRRTKGPVGCGNYFDADTNDIYWISGPKKDGTDRLDWAKSAPVEIDDDARREYWTDIRRQPERVGEKFAQPSDLGE